MIRRELRTVAEQWQMALFRGSGLSCERLNDVKWTLQALPTSQVGGIRLKSLETLNPPTNWLPLGHKFQAVVSAAIHDHRVPQVHHIVVEISARARLI
jgi:hypothetical protein